MLIQKKAKVCERCGREQKDEKDNSCPRCHAPYIQGYVWKKKEGSDEENFRESRKVPF